MTKIEVYQKAKKEVEELETFIKTWNDPSCDKKGFRLTNMETYIGWYGNSSVSSWPQSVTESMKTAMQNNIPFLAMWALEKAKQDTEAKRIAAMDEARAILQETSE